ncbi:MAG TPA: hypothetical protein VGZ06_02525 [Candidatus Cybelea sp.]|jgi:hypothetical protein|nr:hypothetical protein [Candidatus Cybelea sp.]
MDRGLIVGAVAFAVGFAAERLFASMSKDLARYEKLRAMSGEPPLAKELLSLVASVLGDATVKSGTSSLISGLTSDLVRYARIRGM